MLHPHRGAVFLVLPALFAGTAFAATPADRDAAVPVPAPAPAPAPAIEADVPAPSPPSEAPVPQAPPAGEPPAPTDRADDPVTGIVRPGTAAQGCFVDKEEYLDVWHDTGVAPDPCFIPPA